MPLRHYLTALTLLLGLAARVFAANPTVELPILTPSTVKVGPSIVAVTARILDPTFIPGSANVQQIDDAGRVIAILTYLRDDGTAGDAVAVDGTLSAQVTLTFKQPTRVRFRVSAAFRGMLARVQSQMTTLLVTNQEVTGTLAPSNMAATNVIASPTMQVDVLCDEVHLYMKPDADIATLGPRLTSLAATVVGQMPELDLYQLRIPCTANGDHLEETLRALNTEAVVEAAFPVVPVAPQVAPTSDPSLSSQWYLDTIHASAGWDIAKGSAHCCPNWTGLKRAV